MLSNQLRLHPENLNLLLDPTFKRKTIGYYSVNDRHHFVDDESEKQSLIALKEQQRLAEGMTEYEVPEFIADIDLRKGCLEYNDEYDIPKQSHLVKWLENHPESCADVDVVCSHQVAVELMRAPYTETNSMPWEVKLTRGPDGICYLQEVASNRLRFSEMNLYGKQQVFRQRAFKRYMTIKKGDHSRKGPPVDHGPAFYRVNKLRLDSGTMVYPSEAQSFDMNYNTIDFKVQLEGQFDLPAPSVRLNWWCNSHLSGTNTILSGYVHEDDEEEDHYLTRLLSFDMETIKPRIVKSVKFDEEICFGSVCTFVQFIKDLTANGRVASCILRFEPGSKRVCVLDTVNRRPSISIVPGFRTQLSATDETSSVEPSPRTPVDEPPSWSTDQLIKPKESMNGSTLPRLRQVSVNEARNQPPWMSKRNSTTAELGPSDRPSMDESLSRSADESKYQPKRRVNRREKNGDQPEQEMNWFHVSIIMVFMSIAFIFLPMLLTRLEARKH